MPQIYDTIARSGVCAVSGAIAGSIVGGIFGSVYALAGSPHAPNVPVLWKIALGLSVFAWLIVVVMVGIFGNYGVLNAAVKALVTSLVTGVVTVWLIYLLHIGFAGTLLGWLVGFLIGRFFCKMCSTYQTGGATNGVKA
jgi:hypothetical protein